MTRPSGRGRQGIVRIAVVLLAMVVPLGAWRALTWQPPHGPALERLAPVVDALLALQGDDGAFDPFPTEPDLPQILRTGPHALAAAALVQARRAGVRRPALHEACELALDVLVARRQPGGMFGGMPPGVGERWPAVDAAAAAALALAAGGRPGDQEAWAGAVAALERGTSTGLRDGWTRSLVALAFDVSGPIRDRLGRDPRLALRAGDEQELRPGVDEASLAEAVVRTVRGTPGTFAQRIAAASAAEPPAWGGQRSDLPGWWLRAWLAARHPGGAAFRAGLEAALAAGLEAPPRGSLGSSWFADPVTQAALAVLALTEAVCPLGPGPFPGLESE